MSSLPPQDDGEHSAVKKWPSFTKASWTKTEHDTQNTTSEFVFQKRGWKGLKDASLQLWALTHTFVHTYTHTVLHTLMHTQFYTLYSVRRKKQTSLWKCFYELELQSVWLVSGLKKLSSYSLHLCSRFYLFLFTMILTQTTDSLCSCCSCYCLRLVKAFSICVFLSIYLSTRSLLFFNESSFISEADVRFNPAGVLYLGKNHMNE